MSALTPVPAERTREREAFVSACDARFALVAQKLERVGVARNELDRLPWRGEMVLAYQHAQIELRGAVTLYHETLYDGIEAGVEVASLMNHTPARLSQLIASTSAGDTTTSSPHPAAGGQEHLSPASAHGH